MLRPSKILKFYQESNQLNCYSTNRNRNRLNWILTKNKVCEWSIYVLFFASGIVFNLYRFDIGSFSWWIYRNIFLRHIKSELTEHEIKRKIRKFNEQNKKQSDRKKKRNGQVKIKITVKSIRKPAFIWFIHEWVREWIAIGIISRQRRK